MRSCHGPALSIPHAHGRGRHPRHRRYTTHHPSRTRTDEDAYARPAMTILPARRAGDE